MLKKLETRIERLNRLCLQAKCLPIPLEERARLEREAHLGDLPKGENDSVKGALA
jgi:hypothetical protein